MLDWLRAPAGAADAELPIGLLAARLVAALALGCLVAGIYRVTRGGSKSNGQTGDLTATLVLLAVLIAMVTQVIGNNVARAFSLVGALAIVRFRTVVEDTRDTAFVIFAVAVGMALGAGALAVPLVGIPVAAAAAFLFRPRSNAADPGPADATLRVRFGVGQSPDSLLQASFAKYVERSRLAATATARQGAALDVTYAVRLRNSEAALALVTELNGQEGVQEVELRRD